MNVSRVDLNRITAHCPDLATSPFRPFIGPFGQFIKF